MCQNQVFYSYYHCQPKDQLVDLQQSPTGLYHSDKSLDELLATKDFSLTPGADYKLELYMLSKEKGSIKFTDSVVNGTTFKFILDKHSERIEQLERQLESEKSIIRPEDIPDFEID